MSKSIYTQSVVAKMIAMSPLDASMCEDLAEFFNDADNCDAETKPFAGEFTQRGFIAKSRLVEEVTYENAARSVTKTGEPVVRKEELAKSICQALGVKMDESLIKAGKSILVAINNHLQSVDA